MNIDMIAILANAEVINAKNGVNDWRILSIILNIRRFVKIFVNVEFCIGFFFIYLFFVLLLLFWKFVDLSRYLSM